MPRLCHDCASLLADGICGHYGKEPPKGFAERCKYFAQKEQSVTPEAAEGFCDPACPWRETLTLPRPDGGKEEVAGCAMAGCNTWRRLSHMTDCPAKKR